MALLNDREIHERLQDRTGWRREGEAIVRDWHFKDFDRAVTWVNRVAEQASVADHHPDIWLHDFNRVRLSVTNHSHGGLTDADFALADRVDALDEEG